MDWRHTAACRDEEPELFFTIGNHADYDSAPRAPGDFFLVAFEHRKGAASDSANPKQPNIDGFHILRNNEFFGYISHFSLKPIF